MDYGLKDKVILITGGASGLGEAIAIKAAAQGARIAIVDRNAEAAEALSQRLGGARGYGAEVSSLENMERTCRKVVENFGGLNGAVNNAGIGGDWGTVVGCSRENWDRVIGVEFDRCAQQPQGRTAAHPRCRWRKHRQHSIRLGCSRATPGGRCNAVCPSYVRTPMTQVLGESVFQKMEQQHPTGRLVTAAEAADVALFLLSPRSAD